MDSDFNVIYFKSLNINYGGKNLIYNNDRIFDFESGFELIVDNNLYNLDLSYGLLEFSTDGSFIKNNIPETGSLTNTGNFTVSDFTIYQYIHCI